MKKITNIVICIFTSAFALFPLKVFALNEWRTFNKDNSALPSDNIFCVAVDNSGSKWFGTDKGLVQFIDDTWQTFSVDSGHNLADDHINDLVFETNGSNTLLWIATANGVSLLDITNPELPVFTDLYRIDNSGLIDNGVTSVTADPGHVNWFGTFSGVSNYINDTWSSYTKENFWIDHNRVVSFTAGPDSMVYIGTEGGGVSRLKVDPIDGITSASTLNTTWTGFYEPDSGKLTSNNVYAIIIEQNGYQWFGTDSGVALHTSDNTLRDWKNYTSANGLVDDFVQAICKDSDNILWFGTPRGVSKFDGVLWANYTSDDGLADNNVRDIAVDPDGSLWFATANGISVRTSATLIAYDRPAVLNDPILISNFPNPFNPSTSIVFALKNPSFVEIDIYNINGQHIINLVGETRTAGEHHINWSGLNTAGKIVPSGVYFVRLVTESGVNTHKILLTK